MPWVDIEQRTDAWFDLRAGKVTGSEMSKIMAHYGKKNELGEPVFGEPALRLAAKLAEERVTGRPIIDDGFANAHMTHGIQQEPVAIALYEATRFVEVAAGGFFDNKTHGASPDGLIYCDGVLEVKVGIESVHRKRLKLGKIDSSYRWQTTHELYSAQFCNPAVQWLDFVSFCTEISAPDNLFIVRVSVNDLDYLENVKKLQTRLEGFECVVTKQVEELKWK